MEQGGIMEQRQQRLNSGIIFKNDRKQQPSHADYNGEVNVDGTHYYINLWVKVGKSGKTFFSVSVKPKNNQGNHGYQSSQLLEDDELPF